MAKITTPVKGFEGTVAGVRFIDGVGETDNEGALSYFEGHGYGVEHAVAAAVTIPEGEPTEKWSAAELDAFAAREGIDVSKAKNKPERISIFAAHANAAAAKAAEDDDAAKKAKADAAADATGE